MSRKPRIRPTDPMWLPVETGHATPCLMWQGAVCKHTGYGKLRHAGRVVSAHRRMLEAVHGVCLPRHVQVDHLCRVRACVNPAHLEAVTAAVNVRRAVGHITLEVARAMRAMAAQGTTHRAIAARYGVSKALVSNVCSGRAWRE